jgi:MFS-type transporter involved in bile tolerance (Atg22 family)
LVKDGKANKRHYYDNAFLFGGVWVMLYTTVLYSMVYVQSLIHPEAGDKLKTWDAVEDRYLEIMGISMAILFFLTPILGLLNDKSGAERFIPGFFLLHAIFACAMWLGVSTTPTVGGAFTCGFFMILLTVSTAVAVLSNYARDLPSDIRGTSMGFLALASQLIAVIFIKVASALIGLKNTFEVDPIVGRPGNLTAYGLAALFDFIMVIIGVCMVCRNRKAKNSK